LFWKQNSINRSGYNSHTVWTQTGYTNKHCSVNLNGGETKGDGGNDGRINCTLRVKEQALR